MDDKPCIILAIDGSGPVIWTGTFAEFLSENPNEDRAETERILMTDGECLFGGGAVPIMRLVLVP